MILQVVRAGHESLVNVRLVIINKYVNYYTGSTPTQDDASGK